MTFKQFDVNFLPTWPSLKALGESKLARSSIIWSIVIPLLAKMLQPIPNQISLPFLSEYSIDVTLPFNLKIL